MGQELVVSRGRQLASLINNTPILLCPRHHHLVFEHHVVPVFVSILLCIRMDHLVVSLLDHLARCHSEVMERRAVWRLIILLHDAEDETLGRADSLLGRKLLLQL